MLLGLRAVGSALAQVLTHVTASLLANLLATVLSIPIVVAIGALAYGTHSFSLVPLGVALLVGVLPNPCTAGVQVVAREHAAGSYMTFREHWEGFRRYARPATVAWLASLAISALLLANLAFYAHAVGSATGALGALAMPLFLVWLLLFVYWLAMHLFVFPLLMLQEEKSIRLVYRNAFLMTFARPSVLAVVVPIWVAVLLISSATGLVTFIGLTFSASIQHNATAKLLPTFRLSPAS
jgi:hypothetical protein